MKRAHFANLATALVTLSAAGILAVGVHRAMVDGGIQTNVSRVLLNRVVDSEPAAAFIPVRTGTRRRELVAMLIATSQCAGTQNPDFVPAVRLMRGELERRAKAEGKTLRLVGVALDDQLGDGLALLDRIGPFHELSVGGNWLNSNVVAHIWRDSNRSTEVPQWVLLERDVSIGGDAIVVSPDQVVAIVRGADGMRTWVRTSRLQVPSPTASTATTGSQK